MTLRDRILISTVAVICAAAFGQAEAGQGTRAICSFLRSCEILK